MVHILVLDGENQNIWWWPFDLCGIWVAAGQLRHSAAAILPFQLHFCNTAAALHTGNMAPLHFANMAAYKLHFVSPTNCRQLTVAILEEVIWPVIRMFSNFNFRAKRKGLNVAEASQSQPVSQPASQQLDKHECFTVAATGAADSLSSTAAHYWQPSLNGYFSAAEFTAKTRLWICHVIPMVQFSGLAIQDFKFKTSAASCSPFANHETHWLVFFQPHPVQPSSPILTLYQLFSESLTLTRGPWLKTFLLGTLDLPWLGKRNFLIDLR